MAKELQTLVISTNTPLGKGLKPFLKSIFGLIFSGWVADETRVTKFIQENKVDLVIFEAQDARRSTPTVKKIKSHQPDAKIIGIVKSASDGAHFLQNGVDETLVSGFPARYMEDSLDRLFDKEKKHYGKRIN